MPSTCKKIYVPILVQNLSDGMGHGTEGTFFGKSIKLVHLAIGDRPQKN
jgi:hypothetical protein